MSGDIHSNSDRPGGRDKRQPIGTDELPDLVAAYAVDAVDDDEALLVESHLATSADAAVTEQVLRLSAGEYAAAVLPDLPAPARLRDRVRSTALARRRGRPLTPTTPIDLHRIETERAGLLFEQMQHHQWAAPVDPVELAGWTVRDLVVHLLANESLLAYELGVTDPIAPETERTNVERTDATAARLRHATPAEIVAEYRAFAEAVDRRASELTEAELEAELVWWGLPMRGSTALIVRTFETWTHADDIRRALGLAHVAPSAPGLRTMSQRSLEWVPLMMANADVAAEPATATIVLTGPGGGTYTAQLGAIPADPDLPPAFELSIDTVDYCRAIANRLPEGGLPLHATGDVDLARRFLDVVPSLAGV